VGTGAWSIVGNTPGGTLADASNPQSGFSGLPGTTYTLRWTISNGVCAASTDDVSITFNQIGTATTAASATATYGDASVDLVATVTPAAAPGSVQFFVNGAAVGTATLSSGTATFSYNLGGVSADTYTIRASYAGSGPYTASNSSNATLAVAPKALTASVTASGKTYDGTTDATLASRSVSGKVGDDDVTLTGGTAAFADKNVGTNKTVTAGGFSLTGGAAGNYRLATNSATTTASITAKALTIGITATDKVYDGNANATVSAAIAGGLVSGDQVTVAATNGQFNSKNAGAGKTVTASVSITGGNDAGNYAANASATTQADITAKPVTATLVAQDKLYNGNDEATASGSVPAIGSDEVNVAVTHAKFDDKNVGNDKPVTATVALTGGEAGNYRLTSTTASAKASIATRPLLVEVTAQDKVYDGNATAAVSASVVRRGIAVIEGDDLTVTATNGRFDDKNVGENKEVAASISLSGKDAGNYSANATAQTTANIAAKALTASITALDKTYDGTDAATATGSVPAADVTGSDEVTVTVTNARFNNKHAGTGKAVTANVAISNGNYSLIAATAATTADIAPKAIAVTARADAKVYDGTNGSEVAPTTPALQTGDEVGAPAGQRFDNKNVGTGKTLIASGLVINDGNGGNNYSVSYVPNTNGEITAKALTAAISAGDKVYDGNDNATVSASIAGGLVIGDEVTVTAANGKFADKHVGQNKQVTASISKSGDDAANYTVNATAQTTADITAAQLVIAIAAPDKVYDGKRNAQVSASILSGLVRGDDVTVAATNGLFDDKNVGTNKAVTASVSKSGDDAANYTANASAQTTAAITALGIDGSFTAAGKTYDGSDAATVTGRSLDGVLAGDQVTLAGGTARFNNKNVGTDKTVTLNGATLAGTDAANYRLDKVATAKADITAKGLTPAIAAENKTYDGTTTATLSSQSVSGTVNGETVTLVVGAARFDTKNVGTGKTVTATGLSLGGDDAGNYSLTATTATTTASITAKALTASISAGDKVYDGNATATATGSVPAADVVDGDEVPVTVTNARFNNKQVGTGKPVTADVSIGNGNYRLTAATAATTASITPKDLTIGITAADKVYDGTNAATVTAAITAGLVAGDDVTVAAANGAFNNKNVGTDKPVSANVRISGGDDASNYTANADGFRCGGHYQAGPGGKRHRPEQSVRRQRHGRRNAVRQPRSRRRH
jgi:hypothetical protein